jgi:hypothetical protein
MDVVKPRFPLWRHREFGDAFGVGHQNCHKTTFDAGDYSGNIGERFNADICHTNQSSFEIVQAKQSEIKSLAKPTPLSFGPCYPLVHLHELLG